MTNKGKQVVVLNNNGAENQPRRQLSTDERGLDINESASVNDKVVTNKCRIQRQCGFADINNLSPTFDETNETYGQLDIYQLDKPCVFDNE